MHNVTADSARADVVDDGKVTIEIQPGVFKEYVVRPEIVAALKAWPQYYNAGVVGPDGYPDLTFGQTVIHPEETGKWLRHLYNEAWRAQTDTRYDATPQVRAQILAFVYGYMTHAAGDLWAHQLVNEHSEGVFPAVSDIYRKPEEIEIALRHTVIEGLIGDANHGFDGNPDRTFVPGTLGHANDYSEDSTPARKFNAPMEFLYRTLVNPLADLPVNGCNDIFDDDRDTIQNDGCPNNTTTGPVNPPGDAPHSPIDGEHEAYADNNPLTRDGRHGSQIDGAEIKRGPMIDFMIALKAELQVYHADFLADDAHWDCEPGTSDCERRVETLYTQTVRGKLGFELERWVCVDEPCEKDGDDWWDDEKKGAWDEYRQAWIEDIDTALVHWPKLGQALTEALFDPQAYRDTQNYECRTYGADSADPNSIRSKCEEKIGIIDVVFHKVDPWLNTYGLSALGLPDVAGWSREKIDALSAVLDELMGPAKNPIRKGKNYIREELKKEIYAKLNERFGFDVQAAAHFFRHPANWLNIQQPVTVRIKPRLDANGLPVWEQYYDPDLNRTFWRPVLDPMDIGPLFTKRQHERIDALLGLPLNHHVLVHPAQPASYYFPNGLPATYRLSDTATYDPITFHPARNTVTMAKLLLLDGPALNQVIGDSLVSAGILKSASTVNTYRGGTGTFPANIMIDGSNPDVNNISATQQHTWLKSIDSDHAWRQDGLPVFCNAVPKPGVTHPDPENDDHWECARSATNPARENGLPAFRKPVHGIHENHPSLQGAPEYRDDDYENGGHGNFPIWESCVTRPAFRALFRDWENVNGAQFPDNHDTPSPDDSHASPVSTVTASGATYTSNTYKYIGRNHRFTLTASDWTGFTGSQLKLEYRIYKAGTTPDPDWRDARVAYGSISFMLPTSATAGKWHIQHRVTSPCHTLDEEDRLLVNPPTDEVYIYDPNPPVITAALLPSPNATGWTKQDTKVTLIAYDDVPTMGSGVRELEYTATGAQPMGRTVVDGQTMDRPTTAMLTITRENVTDVSYTATDRLGQKAVAKIQTVKLDKTLPTVVLGTPADGAVVRGTLSMSGTASDNLGVASVVFLVDDRPVARDTTTPYESSWTTRADYEGRHVVSSCSIDNADNVGVSPHRTVTVDNIAGDQAPPLHTSLISVQQTPTKVQAHAYEPSASTTGRYIAFRGSGADSFVSDDTNNKDDIYVRDRDADRDGIFDETHAGATKYVLISRTSIGGLANDWSWAPSISGNGRFVAFHSRASNLVPGDTNSKDDVFLHDRDMDRDNVFDEAGATSIKRISVSERGAQISATNGYARHAFVSANGRYVAFEALANNLVPVGDGDSTSGRSQIYVYDIANAKLRKVSVTPDGKAADGPNLRPSLSADGRYVAFISGARNLIPGDVSYNDVVVHDRDADRDGVFDEMNAVRNSRMSVSTSGGDANGESYNRPILSASGRHVAFYSAATNLVVNDTNGYGDVFLRDRDSDNDGIYDEANAAVTELVSVSTCGAQGNKTSASYPNQIAMSANGRYVVFSSGASNLVAQDTASDGDVFLRDQVGGITIRMSLKQTGEPAEWRTYYPSISGNGAFVAYGAFTQLVPEDTQADDDVYSTKREVAAPNTTITGGPTGTVTSTSATFTFMASEAGSSFTCSLDASAWLPCAPGKTYTGLSTGTHTFRVRATDPSSNTDVTPAARTWTVQ